MTRFASTRGRARRDPYRRQIPGVRLAPPSLADHAFQPDPDVPVDYLGRTFCLQCHLPGREGDSRHLVAAHDDSRERAALEARRLGERLED